MSIPKKIAFNSVFSSLAKISWTLISLVAVGFITRHLGAEGFGEYTTILAFFFMLSSLGDLGINHIVLREISYKKEAKNEAEIISIAFTIRLIASILLVSISAVMVWLLPYSISVKKGIILASFGLFFATSYQTLACIFQKRLLAYLVSAAELAGRIANLSWVYFCVIKGLGLNWVIFGMVLSWTTTFIIVFFLTKKQIRLRLNFDFKEAKRLLKNALPLGVAAMITFIYFRVDTILLSILKGSTEVGIYGAAYKIVENVSYFPAMFMGLVMPLYAANFFTNKKRFQKVAFRAFDAISFIAVGISFGVFALAPKIIAIIAGEGFESSILVLRILSLAILGLFYGQYFNSILIAAKFQNKLLKVFIFCAIVNVSLNLIFIPSFSYLAAAVISSLTEILVPLLSLILVFKNCNYLPKLASFIKIIVSGLIMVLFLLFFPAIPILFQIIIGGGIYLMTIFVLKAFSKKDFRQIIKIN